MEIGNVVVAKNDKRLLGEVLAIDEMDRATVKLCESGVEVLMDIASLYCTGSNQPQRESGKTVHILGTEYKILIIEEGDLVAYQRKVIRHEIVHAFLYESGLWQNSYGSKCWAQNEEMVDWFAIQEPKIHSAYIEAGCE